MTAASRLTNLARALRTHADALNVAASTVYAAGATQKAAQLATSRDIRRAAAAVLDRLAGNDNQPKENDMAFQPKTAKDLPAGAEVTGRSRVWVKNRPGRHECWTSDLGEYLSDGTIDRLIAEGAFITRVPTSTCQVR